MDDFDDKTFNLLEATTNDVFGWDKTVSFFEQKNSMKYKYPEVVINDRETNCETHLTKQKSQKNLLRN